MRGARGTLVAVLAGAGLLVTACQMPVAGGSGGSGATTHALPIPSIATQHWAMPNLVGTGLQAAQNRIQKLTGNNVFFTSSHDASGQGRHQIIDSDWKVCTQNVPAGASISITSKIDFGVVKTTENCP